MCAERNALAPVIIKRKKNIIAGGHHGGAWKVAYADFVTAMMAFFMLMWLLNATTEKQRKGIADYFSPSIPVSRVSGGGDGMFGGDSVIGEQDLAQSGHASDKQLPAPAPADPATSGAGFERTVKEMEDRLAGRGGESMTSDSAARHIVTRVTDEGLIVEIFDLPDEPLFAPDTAEPTPLAADLAAVIADVFAMAANGVAVNGHVRAYPSVMKVNPDWDLSIARAVAMRKLMEQAGLAPRRVQRTTGLADRKPATANPMEPRNNRIEIILLRDS